jgi:hypothetical protein
MAPAAPAQIPKDNTSVLDGAFAGDDRRRRQQSQASLKLVEEITKVVREGSAGRVRRHDAFTDRGRA